MPDIRYKPVPRRRFARTPYQAVYPSIVGDELLVRYMNAVIDARPRKWSATTLTLYACAEAYVPELLDTETETGRYASMYSKPKVNDLVMTRLHQLKDIQRLPLAALVKQALVRWMQRNVHRLVVWDRETAIFVDDDDILKQGPSSAPPLAPPLTGHAWPC